MYFFLYFLSKIFLKLSKIFYFFSTKFEKSNHHRDAVIRTTKNYNMHSSSNEEYYIEQYWILISSGFKDFEKKIQIYDLGCGQGRFSFKFAEYFKSANIVGCDFSKFAIDYANNFSINNNLSSRVTFINESIADFSQKQNKNSADLIILTEVVFYYPDWQNDLDIILSLLKPNGKIILSVRSQYFNALNLVKHKNFDKLDLVINKRQGQLFDGPGKFTWQTSEEIKNLLIKKNLLLDNIFAIGSLSGIEGDPHEYVCEPSKLSQNEQKKLMDIEIELGKSNLDSGRYLLVVAHKPHH